MKLRHAFQLGIDKILIITFKSAKVQGMINLLVQIFRLCSVGLPFGMVYTTQKSGDFGVDSIGSTAY